LIGRWIYQLAVTFKKVGVNFELLQMLLL
jgi:hypothetical protein